MSHIFQGNQLDFLLDKASQYSNFIANDLKEVQSEMADAAKKVIDKANRKKRKQEGAGKNGKKPKLQVGTSDTIFLQPENLADGCYLKDYQLEGVRWLASLYQNGVSGTVSLYFSRYIYRDGLG